MINRFRMPGLCPRSARAPRTLRAAMLAFAVVATVGVAQAADRPTPSKMKTSGVSLWTFKNSTGLPDDAVFVQIPNGTLKSVCGGTTALPKCFSSNGGQVFSLAQLKGNVPNAGKGGPTGSVPLLFLDNASSARLIYTLGSPSTASTVAQGLVEMTVSGKAASNNLDVSYVNAIGVPASLSVRNRSNGSLVTPSQTGLWPSNQVRTTSGATIFKQLIAAVPASAVTTASYAAKNDAGQRIGIVSGTISVTSPSTNAAGYHDWSKLIGSGASASLASYQPPAGSPLAGTLYGFSQVTAGKAGSLPSSPFVSNPSTLAGPTAAVGDTLNAFLAAQSYTLTATFSSDLNPKGANARLTSLGAYSIPAGTAGVKISGYGNASGAPSSAGAGSFDIYVTSSQLNAATGIYGANPWYVVDWTGNATPSAVATNNTNSLADRVVGDLMAEATFGMIGSTTKIGAQMTRSGTSANFANSPWSTKTTTTIGALGSGQYFYLLALQQTPAQFAQWVGSNIQSDSAWYDVYGNAFQSLTQAYAFAYSDRINGSVALDPDLFYSGGSAPPDIDGIYIEIELLPGGYTYTPKSK